MSIKKPCKYVSEFIYVLADTFSTSRWKKLPSSMLEAIVWLELQFWKTYPCYSA